MRLHSVCFMCEPTQHWEQLKPTAVISQLELERRMKAPVPFEPQSFWAA